jgi:predicted ATPase
MRIETIKLTNFKAFRSLVMENIPPLCVIVGANGTGKTTLFGALGFLKDCMTYNVKQALEKLGGFEEVRSRGVNNEPIIIELQFRMIIAGVERLITYVLEINQERGKPFIAREILRYKRGSYGSPFHFLDFSRGKGYAIINEQDFKKEDADLLREEQSLDTPDILAIKGLGQFERFKAANAFRQLIENWHISDFHIKEARGSKSSMGYEEHLSASGDNLQRIAYRLYNEERDIFNKIVQQMQRHVPGVTSVTPLQLINNDILLKFGDSSFSGKNSDFIDSYVSDGTIKMFAYLVLLYDPKPHAVLCVEEPENQLYPTLLEELAEEFESYAQRGGQVFVSTHSPDLLNAINIDSVFWLTKKQGYTSLFCAKEDAQLVSFMKLGDKMGHLWKQGFFKDADPI